MNEKMMIKIKKLKKNKKNVDTRNEFLYYSLCGQHEVSAKPLNAENNLAPWSSG